MNRDKMIEAAKRRYKQTGCIKPGCYGCAAEFAIEEVKAERKRIATTLNSFWNDAHSQEDFIKNVGAFARQLEAE